MIFDNLTQEKASFWSRCEPRACSEIELKTPAVRR
jgi:hypothetical protein